MDPENLLPEDLTALDAEALADLQSTIDARADELADQATDGELSDDDVAEIERLADARDTLKAEGERRDGEASAKKEKAQAALARLRGGDAPAEGEDVDAPAAEPAPAEAIAAAVTPEAAPAAEPAAVEAPTVEAIAAEVIRQQAAAANAIGLAAVPPSAAALAAARPGANAPKRSTSTAGFMVATGKTAGISGNQMSADDPFADRMSVATAIAEAKHRMGHVGEGTFDQVSLATGRKELPDVKLSHDAVQNFGILRDMQEGALVAAGGGGYCAPYTPQYDFFRLAERQSPVEDDLQSVQAVRGGIQFMTPMDWRDAIEAIGTQTKAQNTAGTVKPVLTLSCSEVQTAEVRAISSIVKFDNLQYRTFPEQVEAFLEDVAVAFDFTKESYYLSEFAAHSTTVSSAVPYGASRGLLWDWATSAAQYRKRNAMKRDSVLKLYAPDWSVDAVKADLSVENDRDFGSITDAEVVAAVKALNLDPIWYNDLGNGANQIGLTQAAGNLNAWPDQVVSYLHSPGSFVRLDGGSLDLGIVRDSTLNGTNDLEIFMEEWIGMAFMGIESIRLVSSICPNGTAPALVSPFTC